MIGLWHDGCIAPVVRLSATCDLHLATNKGSVADSSDVAYTKMQSLDSPKDSLQLKTLWIVAVCSAAAVLLLSVIEVLSLSITPSRISVVAASLFVSVFVSRYQPRIPRTQIRLSPKDILGFWGVIWLGV